MTNPPFKCVRHKCAHCFGGHSVFCFGCTLGLDSSLMVFAVSRRLQCQCDTSGWEMWLMFSCPFQSQCAGLPLHFRTKGAIHKHSYCAPKTHLTQKKKWDCLTGVKLSRLTNYKCWRCVRSHLSPQNQQERTVPPPSASTKSLQVPEEQILCDV